MDRPEPPEAPDSRRFLRAGVRVALLVALVAVLVAPVAAGWAVSHTAVRAPVGITPTTFSVQLGGHSEVRLGLLGSLDVPHAWGPVGLVATADGPVVPDATSGDLASLVSSRSLELYTGLLHDPEASLSGYVDVLLGRLIRQFMLAEALLVVVGLGLVGAVHLSRPSWRLTRDRRTAQLTVGGLVLGTVTSVGAGWMLAMPVRPAAQEVPPTYALPSLDGTFLDGSTTDSALLRLLIEDAVPRIKVLAERQESLAVRYRATAVASLRAQEPAMTGPRPGETAVLLQSDMHCNRIMIELQRLTVTLLRERYGEEAPALLAVTGDLTTNGTPAERSCIEDEAAIAQEAPVAAVTGNHESQTSAEQMDAAGMTVLDGDTEELAGVRVLGDGDPERTELFGGTHLRGEETQGDVGRRLREVAAEDRPDLLLVHEGYAAAGFLGVDDVRALLEDPGSPIVRRDDGVPDVPAGAVFYGHWHRSVEPRVLWNSDGTWTLLMELNTSGGAVDQPTFTRFSTPWSAPRQPASYPVLFLDTESGLVRGYQIYRFGTDGQVEVQPRVNIGDVSALGDAGDGGDSSDVASTPDAAANDAAAGG